MISAISGQTVCTDMISAISSLTIGAYTISTISGQTICTDVISAVGSLTVWTYTICAISCYTDRADVSMFGPAFSNDGCFGHVVVDCIDCWKSERARRQNREGQAEDQFVGFHEGVSK
ncbi:hypothetical protein AO070_10160 [Pseudomonas syringae pv. syringae PD2766]|nr:hypothetical protein AO070_10160 [Pseudomonas syringae pv. syringae PD2766]